MKLTNRFDINCNYILQDSVDQNKYLLKLILSSISNITDLSFAINYQFS